MKILYCCFLAIFLFSCSSFVSGPTPEPITIRFGFLGQILIYEVLVQQFQEENPGITIEIVQCGEGQRQNLDDFLTNADVVWMISEFLNSDRILLLLPLNEWISNDPKLDRAEFINGLMQTLQFNDKKIGILAGISPMVLFYENLRFEIAKIVLPNAGKVIFEDKIY